MTYQLLGSHDHDDEASPPSTVPNPRGTTATAIIERRSLSLGLAVGLFIEGFSLLWHFLVVKERANNENYDGSNEGHNNAVESVVALVLWSLIATAAPFVVLDHLRGLVLEESNDADDDDDLKSITQRLERMECRFGAGVLLGGCTASAALDLVLGFQGHFWFSLGIGVTAASCVLLPRLYRAVLSRQGQPSYSRQQRVQQLQQQEHPNRHHRMQAIDPETMNFVELTPGTLRLETL